MSPEDKLLRAIFGPKPSAEEQAAHAAEKKQKDVAEAERLAAQVQSADDWTGLTWRPAIYWGNPHAVALHPQKNWVYAMMRGEEVVYTQVLDPEELEVIQ